MTIQAPLPSTIKGSKVFPRQNEYLVNLIRTAMGLISRPSLELVSSVLGEPRGMFVYNNTLYSVYGQKLYSGTSTLTEIGEITGSGLIRFAKGFNHTAITTGGTNYLLDASGSLSTITDPDLPACRDVVRIRGRFVWVPVDGESLIFSDVGQAGSIGSISKFDAESFPDKNIAAANIRNELFALDAESIERFRDVGTEDFPFVPVDNAAISVGYVGGKILTKDSLIFLGKDKDNGYAFYIIQDGLSNIISNETVNESLNLDYTREQLEAVKAQRFNWRGIDCYVFSFHDKTYLFQNGEWVYIDQGIIAPTRFSTFDYENATLFGTTWYLQDKEGLYKLSALPSDSKGDIARQFTSYARSPDKKVMSVKYAELENLQGATNKKGSIGLSLSRDNKVWSSALYSDLASIGQYTDRLRWSAVGGLGRYEGLVGYNIYTTDPIEFSADNMLLEI